MKLSKLLTIFLVVVTSTMYAQSIGVKTASPNAVLDVNGSVAYREGTPLSIVNGANNNVVIDSMSFYRIVAPTAAFNITGFSSGFDGRLLTIINATSYTMTLKHLNTGSTAANRINTGGSDILVAANGVVNLYYNTTLANWIVTSSQGTPPNLTTINTGSYGDSLITIINGILGRVPPQQYIETYAWGLDGNTGTVDGTHFLGTTDNIPLSIRVNNIKSGRIDHLLSNAFWGYQSGVANTTGQYNSALGHTALGSNTTANDNTAFGYQSLVANTTGYSNTAIGSRSMANTTTGYDNVAVGFQALLGTTTGYYNTALGYQALASNTTAGNNTAVGGQALLTNTTGNTNVANGFQSLYFNSLGSSNTAGGAYSMFANNTGNNNTALGTYALGSNTTAWGSTAVGYRAAFSNITGQGNVAIGDSALYANTTVTGLTAVGYQAGATTTANYGTFLGYQAGKANTTGTNNTMLGYQAGLVNTTGLSNTFVGYLAGTANVGGSTNVALGTWALTANTSGASNVALGSGTLGQTTTGNNSIAIGTQAGSGGTTGSNHVYIGYQAGANTTSGDGNVFIGYNSAQSVATSSNNTLLGNLTSLSSGLSNATAIGYNAIVAASNSLILGGTGSNSVYVGVGTTTPVYKMHLEDAGGPDADYVARLYNTNTAGYLPSVILQTARGTKAAPTAVNSGTILGAYRFAGFDGSAFSDIYACELRGNATETWSTTAHGTSLNIATIPNGTTSPVDRMIVDQNGNVGIGLTSPSVKLHQDNGTATANYHKFTANGTTGQTTSDGFDVGIDASGNAILNQKEALPLIMSANNAEVMRVTSAGNVLIGGNLTPGEVTSVALVNQSASDQKDDITITTYNTTTTPAFVIFKARGTAAAPTALTNNELIGGFNANGYTGTAFTGLTAITSVTASDYTTSFGADIAFKTTRSGTSNERMRIMSTGNVGIGVAAPSHILQINGQGRATVSTWATTSDRRLKDIDGKYEYGLKELLRINTYRFHYKNNNPLNLPTDKPFQGTIAQELQKIIPEAVQNNPDGYLTVNNDPVFWAMLNSIKELNSENEKLKTTNDALKAELNAVKMALNKQGNLTETLIGRLEKLEAALNTKPVQEPSVKSDKK